MRKQLSDEARVYLREVFGCDDPETLGAATLRAIRENAEDAALAHGENRLDREIVEWALVRAVYDVLPDLKHYASTHGPGPDRRLAALLAALGEKEGSGDA